MPLEILAALVVFGILGLAIALHFLGMSRQLQFADSGEVERHWHRLFEGVAVTQCHFSDSRSQVLLQTENGPGLVWAIGQDSVARLVLKDVKIQENPKGLIVTTGDFSAPKLTIDLASATDRQHWRARLERKANG